MHFHQLRNTRYPSLPVSSHIYIYQVVSDHPLSLLSFFASLYTASSSFLVGLFSFLDTHQSMDHFSLHSVPGIRLDRPARALMSTPFSPLHQLDRFNLVFLRPVRLV